MHDLFIIFWVTASLAFAQMVTGCQTPDPLCERLRAGIDVIERGRRHHQIPEDEARDQLEVQHEALKIHNCLPKDSEERHESPADDHMTE